MSTWTRCAKVTSVVYTFMGAPALTQVGVLFCVAGLLLHLASVLSPAWEHATSQVGSSHSGLWKVCILDKCDYFINHELWGWFYVVQGLMVASLLGQTAGLAVWVVNVTSARLDRWRFNLRRIRCFVTAATFCLTLISVAVYGAYQGGGDDFDTLSWGYALAVLAAMCQLLTPVFFTLRLFLVKDEKVNQTPLISPAGSTLSLDEDYDLPVHEPTPGRPVRMRGYSFCPTETEYTPVPVNSKDRSFSFTAAVPDTIELVEV